MPRRLLVVPVVLLLCAGLFALYRAETWRPGPVEAPHTAVLYKASSEKALPPPAASARMPERGIPKRTAAAGVAAALAVFVVGTALSGARKPNGPGETI